MSSQIFTKQKIDKQSLAYQINKIKFVLKSEVYGFFYFDRYNS